MLAYRISTIKPSATLAITAKANELRRQGVDIISMASGEPDFDTPQHIKQAGIDAINAGKTRYTAVDGIPTLKQAVIEKFARDNQLTYEMNEVIVSSGGKQVFANLCQALLEEGDEVIIPAPYWVSYPDMVLLAGATPVICSTSINDNFKLSADKLAQAITPKTKLFILNSPSNPTGAIYSHREIKAIAEVLEAHPQIWILSDDIYEHIRWNHESFLNPAMLSESFKQRTIILNGVSKAYAMTGWRIGFGSGDAKVIGAMKKVQSQSTSNPCSISQVAAETALRADQDFIKEMMVEFQKRYDYISAALNSVDGVQCPVAEGAFYVLPDVNGLIKRLGLKDDIDLAAHCLEKLEIAIVPGSAFGAPNCIRFSFATSMPNIKTALERFAQL